MTTYIKRFWKENLFLTLLLLVEAVSQTSVLILIGRATDHLATSDFDEFVRLIIIISVMWLGTFFIISLRINVKSRVKQRMAIAIRADIAKRLEQSSYEEYHKKSTGTYASWLSNDLTQIEEQGFEKLYLVLANILQLLTSSVGLLVFHWSLILWVVSLSVGTLFLPKLVQKKYKDATVAVTRENELFLSRVNDVLQGFDTLFSFNLLEVLSEKIKNASEDLAKSKNHHQFYESIATALGTFGNVFGQISTLALSGWLVVQQLTTIGAIVSTLTLSSQIFNTVGDLAHQLMGIRSIDPIFDKFAAIEQINEKKQPLPSIHDGLSLDKLRYGYGDKEVFNGLSYSFDLGKKYAIVGESGSGKSTLLNILNGKLTNYEGNVRISGHELKEIDGQSLREELLYLDQIPYIFDETIRENITLNEEFSEEEILQAIEDSALTDVIEKLSNGIHTPVGEAGRSFSGGQKQRIALARGLIRGKNIILLDEGTSSLDEESALKIEERLLNNPELTVIMITHHLRESIREKLDGVLSLTQKTKT